MLRQGVLRTVALPPTAVLPWNDKSGSAAAECGSSVEHILDERGRLEMVQGRFERPHQCFAQPVAIHRRQEQQPLVQRREGGVRSGQPVEEVGADREDHPERRAGVVRRHLRCIARYATRSASGASV